METIQQILLYVRQLDQHLNDLAGGNLLAFYAIMFAIIFAETGLVVMPFLPGDSLLFALGTVAALSGSPVNLPLLVALLIVAAVLGDAVNYAIGYRLGPKVFKYEKSWFFNPRHLLKAQAFYEKYGSKTIILARFVPIVRTFAPFVAGIGKMEYRRFAIFNIVGGAAWVVLCIGSGYFFGGFEWVKQHFEAVVVAIILISVLPMAIEFMLEWRKSRKGQPEASAETPFAPKDEQAA